MVTISDKNGVVIHKVNGKGIVISCGKNEVNSSGGVIIMPRVGRMMWVKESISVDEF